MSNDWERQLKSAIEVFQDRLIIDIRIAVVRERERCAKIAEDYFAQEDVGMRKGIIAAKIREEPK